MAKRKKSTVTEGIRQAVLDSGHSLNEIARQTGVDVGNLSKFVSGQRGLSLEKLDALCKFLGLFVVRPGGAGKIRRGAARLILGAAIAASHADPTPINEALAALLSVGHTRIEACAMIEKATTSGREFTSAADVLAAVYQS